MKTKTFNLSLPAELVILLDARAKKEFATRSEYIKRAVVAQLKADGALGDMEASQTPDQAKKARLKEFLGAQAHAGYKEDIY